MYAFSSLLYGLNPQPLLLLSSFLITLAVYTLNIYTDVSEDQINKKELYLNRKHFLVISLVSIFVSLGIGALYGLMTCGVIFFYFLSGLLYSMKIFPGFPRLKEVLGGKSLTVAITWALTFALLPLRGWAVGWEIPVMVFIYIFIQLFINTVLFDVVDMEGDSASGITTIPIYLGKRGTVKFLLAINTLSVLWVLYALLRGLFSRYILGLLFGVLYSYMLIYFFGCKEQTRLLQEIFIDGEWIPIVSLLLVIG